MPSSSASTLLDEASSEEDQLSLFAGPGTQALPSSTAAAVPTLTEKETLSSSPAAGRPSTGLLDEGEPIARAEVSISGLDASPFSASERRALPILEAAMAVIGPGPRTNIASLLDIDLFERFTSGRDTATVDARAVAGHYLGKKLGWTNTEIAELLSCDRTTVTHHTSRVEDYLSCDATFSQRYEEFTELLPTETRPLSYHVEKLLSKIDDVINPQD